MTELEQKEFLDYKADFYENPKFIEDDPIQIPHQFLQKEDIEISAFLISTIAWGNRKSIIKSGEKMLQLMDFQPYNYILNFSEKESNFVHRTFNGSDLVFFIRSLKNIYSNHNGLENVFHSNDNQLLTKIANFRKIFMEVEHEKRSEKHISNPLSGSASKRLIMYLRWMVRSNKKGVDFGLWKSIQPSSLMIPLDVHTGNIASKLGLISRKQFSWQTNEELISKLRNFDSIDPAKYDFALFGLGAYEKFYSGSGIGINSKVKSESDFFSGRRIK
jgi:uncharacterized protein (TIGR02757 family)